MVNTSNRAELLNCIENAQNCMIKMGKTIAKMTEQQQEKQDLERLCYETGTLLREARQRYDQLT